MSQASPFFCSCHLPLLSGRPLSLAVEDEDKDEGNAFRFFAFFLSFFPRERLSCFFGEVLGFSPLRLIGTCLSSSKTNFPPSVVPLVLVGDKEENGSRGDLDSPGLVPVLRSLEARTKPRKIGEGLVGLEVNSG